MNNLAFSMSAHPSQLSTGYGHRCLNLRYRQEPSAYKKPALKRLAGRAMEHRKHQVIYAPTLTRVIV